MSCSLNDLFWLFTSESRCLGQSSSSGAWWGFLHILQTAMETPLTDSLTNVQKLHSHDPGIKLELEHDRTTNPSLSAPRL
mmetsp:Transcript_4124/g.8904  ORF Transcript_4124/g.8904 Transcript_4124/m.8904 type:complete len:80 (-) Transcript_4124:1343-1582(-)